MKFNFKKITSALASSAMFGTTFALAAAASFPAPFVSNGAADVAIVYGNSLDLVAVTDISTALSTSLAGGSSGSATASDDAYPLFTGSTPIQLNNSISSVRTSISETNLPSVLGKEDFSGNVDAQMTFNIVPGTNRVIYQKQPTSSDDPVNAVAMTTSASTYFYNATVSFNRAVNFTHADSKNEEIQLFGQTFLVVSATDTTTLVLFKSAETEFLTVGGTTSTPSATVVVEDETYTVELTAATDTSATLKVTDSSGASDQKEVNEAASKKILGVEVGVNNADESTATNTLSAEVIVGANRISLTDNNQVTVGTSSDAIDGTDIDFVDTEYTGNITKLTVQVFAEDGSHDFLKSGDEFIDPVFGSFRLTFDSLSVEEDSEDREDVTIKPSGTDMGAITFTSWEDETLSNWDWLNNRSSQTEGAYLGDSNSWRLQVAEFGQVNESGFAVLG